MPKLITKIKLLADVNGDAITVRQVSLDDLTGEYIYGEAVELTNGEKNQIKTIAKALARRLEVKP